MKTKLIVIGIFCMILLTETVSATSPYGKMDVYYNGRLLPGSETAKPILKIGEPFTVGINLTVYQKCYVSVMLSEIGDNDFEIINGSTSRMNDYGTEILDKNSTKYYEWTVKATGNWAGGSLPIDFVYQINDFETGDILVNSGFTIAYPYISNEYYEGEDPVSKTQPTPEQPASENSSPTASAPAFSLVTAILALALVFFRFSRQ